ncbi:UDP-glucose/GDP-mannose dehydrogenase family protein [Brochothrix thermosphacta]|uniref:UDP-glucose dehydrogenase family protein n=1 Tax=Brochothrix thermosphacta TaxID=2756 RepID=UPI002713FF41|nr:UDP-glucose/GDP-mannose dehydrogenase family protein [Brochothrix thermosphacta]MDO7863787.1 UDP-glucose/GDP-mannose dehydrogenase family protein [Brochothrix thermosphacta]
MEIVVIGTVYVGLVTGVSLSEIGHQVTCIDTSIEKITKLKKSISPIYEPGIEELIEKNVAANRLFFGTDLQAAMKNKKIVYLTVGTPQNPDGTANLVYLEAAAIDIAKSMVQDTIVVVKSTVPVGTNEKIKKLIEENTQFNVAMVSNPVFEGDRIVLGANDKKALETIAEVNNAFAIPIYKTNLESAEMIKYASNAFLATKISFINEIANICEKTGANIEQVSTGMGLDSRIGSKFLNAGIGYGGSCFPKDTAALSQIAGTVNHDFKLLKAVIEVNEKQKLKLVDVLKTEVSHLQGKKIALLGLAFKPETDDIRESASQVIIENLLVAGANIHVYDPIAQAGIQAIFGDEIVYEKDIESTIIEAEAVLIITEWDEIKAIKPAIFKKLMRQPIVLDGRLIYNKAEMSSLGIKYYSVGDGTNASYKTDY